LLSEFQTFLATSFVGNFVGPIFAILLPLMAYHLGASTFQIGLVGGVTFSLYSFVPFVAGSYSDTLKTRKIFIIFALVLLVLTSALYSQVQNTAEIIVLRLFEGLAWSIFWPLLDAMVSEETSQDVRKSLTVYNVTLSSASIIGPVVGGFLLVAFADIRNAFVVTTILLSVTLLLNLIRFKKQPNRGTATNFGTYESADKPLGVKISENLDSGFARRNRILILIVVLPFVSAIRGILFTFLAPLGQSVGVPEFLLGSIAFAFGAGRTFAFSLNLRADFRERLLGSRKIGTNILLLLTLASIAGVIPLIPDKTGTTYLISLGFTGIATGLTTALAQVELIASSDPKKRGRNAGILESCIGIGLSAGPIIAGITARGSLSKPLLVAPAGLVIIIPVTLWLIRRESRIMRTTVR